MLPIVKVPPGRDTIVGSAGAVEAVGTVDGAARAVVGAFATPAGRLGTAASERGADGALAGDGAEADRADAGAVDGTGGDGAGVVSAVFGASIA